MIKKLVWSSRFNKDMKRMVKQNKNMKLIHRIITKLEKCETIPPKYIPHSLKGIWKNYFECHIQSDWLLIWKEDNNTIYLARTGSHSELFKK